MRRVRGDLAICFLIAMLLIFGANEIRERTGIFDNLFEKVWDNIAEKEVAEVPEDEVGGIATDKILRVGKNEEELRAVDSYFTMELTAASLYNMGTVTGETNEWQVLKLDNGKLAAVKINKDNMQEKEDGAIGEQILPVGKVVYEDCEAYELIKSQKKGYDVIDDFYIDMDGEAGASKAVSKGIVAVAWVVAILIPLLVFAAMFGLILGLHAIGVKVGIFPPLFPKKKKGNN